MSYRELATRPVLAWAGVASAARLPVAMAPLALVFLVREQPGGYSLGAVLAAVYVVGEIVAAPVLGVRLDAERARPHLAVGLAVGATGFAGLGVVGGEGHPVLLGALAFLAGAAPAAAPGGLRALLTGMVPQRAVTQAMSLESVLTFGIWAAAPALATGLALGVAPAVPPLLQAVLMALSVAGLWLLPAGWSTREATEATEVEGVKEAEGATETEGAKEAEDDGGSGKPGARRTTRRSRTGEPGTARGRVLARAWPVYVTGAAGLTLLALAELILPALLEQRAVPLAWAGPLLAGFSIGSAVGAFLYGLRDSWPGRLPVQSAVLVGGVAAGVALVAVLPWAAAIGVTLVAAGLLQAPAMLTRNLALRQILPPQALAAGYSVMYAAVGAGYAASGTLAGALLEVVAPSTAILCGVVLTLALTALGLWGERRIPPLGTEAAEAGEAVRAGQEAQAGEPAARKVRR
ncbi:MFS transporter [Streptomyces roseoviridis]|uniref:MFS transporter n=1 Tax=Streptomyces roseoviridis TaxID=67361 RepID=A0ABV5QIY1_9ACTN